MLSKVISLSESLMSAKEAQHRIESILNETTLDETSTPQVPKDNSIKFKDVFFKYEQDGKTILNGVTFNIPDKSTTAIVGHSGSGKTTVASLIPRFWDVESGSVSIGGVNVKDISTSELMDRVSFVFQDNHIFKTTILENVKMAKPTATDTEVMSALESAMCMDIVRKFPDGLNTVIGSNGVYLSGGEVQRITLARAILKDAPIVILDEATAFADPENEHEIQKALERLIKGKTVLMIAHRLSTVCNADNIIVMEQGSICESGTHKELLAKDGVYASMWEEYQSAINWKL
jgi:ATP-binding cassette subfamily B protein